MEKLEDVKTFIRGVYCYGWIGFAPCRKMVREIFHRVFQAIGTLGYAGTALKRALLFVHIDVAEVNLVRQVKPLARRNAALAMRGVGLMPVGLDNEVRRGLTLFGWVFTAGAWRRSDFVFTLEPCLVSSHWGRISHHIRESIRSHHFASLHRCKRHEFVQQEIPLISDERLKLVRKWIRNDSVAMMLAIGAGLFMATTC